MRELLKSANAHFEAIFLGWMWLNASALAVIVGKPWLGCIGLVTVLPALAAYAWRVRGRERTQA